MYRITCDGFILHDPRLGKKYMVIDPSCDMSLNTSGTLKFKIPPTHPNYDKIEKLKSEIELKQDGEWMFSGRVLDDESDFYNVKTIEVEGELSYLVDSNQRQAEFHNMPVDTYVNTIIYKHNSMVEDKKKFVVGVVTVKDDNDSIYRFSNYETTFQTFKEKLINKLGGYVRIRHENGVKYIDYIEDYENVNTQTINFGKNLLDFKKYVSGDDICTAIIPLGAKQTTTTTDTTTTDTSTLEQKLTIESVNDGIDFVYDQEAVDMYGWIFEKIEWTDVTEPSNLLRKAKEELMSRKMLNVRLELSALDLHLLDVDIEKIKLGDKIRVISPPHNFDNFMMVSSMKIDLEEPEKSKINLGYSQTSLTDVIERA